MQIEVKSTEDIVIDISQKPPVVLNVQTGLASIPTGQFLERVRESKSRLYSDSNLNSLFLSRL